MAMRDHAAGFTHVCDGTWKVRMEGVKEMVGYRYASLNSKEGVFKLYVASS